MDITTLQLILFVKENFESFFVLVAISMLRPLGLTLSFIVLTWALPPVSLIRTGLAFVLALPVMFSAREQVVAFINGATILEYGALSAKEVAIGFALGVLASVPFVVMRMAGDFIDQYRGEFNAAFQSPDGGAISTLARLFLVASFLVFAAIDGPQALLSALYSTYDIWPIFSTAAIFQMPDPLKLVQLFDYTFVRGLMAATPLLFALVFIDFVTLMAGRMARGFNGNDLSFILKNLVSLLTLPLLLYVLLNTLQGNVTGGASIEILRTLKP